MTDDNTIKPRPDRRVYIYFSEEAWEALIRLHADQSGKLSATVNELILAEDKRRQTLYSK